MYRVVVRAHVLLLPLDTKPHVRSLLPAFVEIGNDIGNDRPVCFHIDNLGLGRY